MALDSSGALHSCEDHLQNPRSVSAACLESLAFTQSQNGNASNSSVPLFFPPPSLISDCSHPSATGVSLLGSSAHLALFFTVSALSRESAPLSISFACLALAPFLPPKKRGKKPFHLFPTVFRRGKSLKGLFCS